MKSFPYFRQSSDIDCGPTCLKMIAHYYEKNFDYYQMQNTSSAEGYSMLALTDAADKMGFKTRAYQGKISMLKHINLPSILYWHPDHFVVLFEIKDGIYSIADPATGIRYFNKKQLLDFWQCTKNGSNTEGIVMTF